MKKASVSLVISTYNWVEALNLCLTSVFHQSVLPGEVVVADDGSDSRTRKAVEHFAAHAPFPVRHIWHEDKGFRLAAIRNRAFAACQFEYVIQVDGDLILHRHFIKDHLRASKSGYFMTGTRVLLDAAFSERLLRAGTPRVSLFGGKVKKFIYGVRMPALRFLFYEHKSLSPFHGIGCNMAFFKADLLAVNGYNEAIEGWGREDNELMCRLMNLGIRKRSLKFSGIVYHIYHRERATDALFAKNDKILQETLSSGQIRCDRGMQPLSEADSKR